MSRSDKNTTRLHNRAINSGLFESGRPMLLAPPSPSDRIGTDVLIAWNRSTEQARATALAMPLLQKADRVTLLTVIGGTEVSGPSAEQFIQYLRRNEIGAELKRLNLMAEAPVRPSSRRLNHWAAIFWSRAPTPRAG